MNRRQFTDNITKLIQQMITDGNEPVLDYALRSKEEQQRLFNLHLSKCDGIEKISDHQRAHAVDIYFVIDGILDFGSEKTKEINRKYHDIWIGMGGKPMIEWDAGHYGSI